MVCKFNDDPIAPYYKWAITESRGSFWPNAEHNGENPSSYLLSIFFFFHNLRKLQTNEATYHEV